MIVVKPIDAHWKILGTVDDENGEGPGAGLREPTAVLADF
jgi:hypothetical protein